MDDFTKSHLKHFVTKLANAINNENQEDSKKQDQIDSISETSLDILVDAAIYHMKRVANQAMKVAEHAGRTEVNVLDVFDGLWAYNESCESICDFIIDFPKCDISIQASEYPISMNENPGQFPYRADALIEFNGLSEKWVPPQVPQFLPSMAEDNFDDLTENDPDFNVPITEIQTDIPLPVINVNIPVVDNIVKGVIESTNSEYVQPK